MSIKYRAGYKYVLHETYTVQLDELQNRAAEVVVDRVPLIVLTSTGLLTIRAGYAWDGPSGPTYDSRSFMRGSLVHDALYQLGRAGKLAPEDRDVADQILARHCKEDGMWAARRWWVYRGVRTFSGFAYAQQAPEVLTAP